MAGKRGVECRVCATITPGDLIELDLLVADPMRWPQTIWKGFAPPKGGLPASYRRFGAMEMGLHWLTQHPQYAAISKGMLRKHLRYDVPVIDADPEALVARGLIVSGEGTRKELGEPIDPFAYVKLYNEGIKLGLRGLDLLAHRIDNLLAKGDDVPFALIKMIVDAGIKLSSSQAAIVAGGKRFGEVAEEDDAFRGEPASPRFGDVRVRVIDGESRPVYDRGQADRNHYNERARDEGSPTVGGY